MRLAACILCLCLAGPALAQFNETEPNDTKATAQVINMTVGGTITGRTTGSSTTVAGPASADYFELRMPLGATGVYRNRLQVNSATVGHTVTIRGLTVINRATVAGSDAALQTSTASTNPSRYVQWFSFGQGERLIVRVTGTANTTADYTLTHSIEPVNVIDATPSGGLLAGNITITCRNQGHTTDTDLWVLGENFVPIPGYGNDDSPAGVGGPTLAPQSTLTREYLDGVYILALTTYNLELNQISPADDGFTDGSVTDYPGLLISSSSSSSALELTYAMGGSQFQTFRGGPFEMSFYRFRVGEAPICRVDLDGSGNVDFNDYLEFLNLFNSQDLRVDFDGSGNIDFNDYLEFLNLFNAGC